MKIISWNVNGLRAILKKDFAKQILATDPDIVCIQETKTNQPLLAVLPDYKSFWGVGERAGYSGTLILVKEKWTSEVQRVTTVPVFLTQEGRLVVLETPKFYLLNTYFPNGGMGPERLAYKMRYYREYLKYIEKLQKNKAVIFAGDVNTAHHEIDLARPKANEKNTGFLPEERAWLDAVERAGFVDGWRAFNQNQVGYTWWDYKTRARDRNVGWRIDYFFCSNDIFGGVKSVEICSQFYGSDHVPVLLTLSQK